MKPFDVELEGLVARYRLPERAFEQVGALVAVLERPAAPTSVHEPERVLRAHIADSLVALELEATHTASAIVDIGAGAGLPGLPLAVALPGSVVWVLESQRRKCAFVEAACEEVGIENVRIACARAEEWREGVGGGR